MRDGCVVAAWVGGGAVEPRDLGSPRTGKGDGPFFSLSHSSKLTMIAVGEVELGLDWEKVRHLASYLEIARNHFSESEFSGLDQLSDDDRLLAFYRCWTRKEAYIKALGDGLSIALGTFDVSLGETPELLACRDRREQPKNWSMLDVSPGPEFVAAIALRAKPPDVKTFRLRLASSGERDPAERLEPQLLSPVPGSSETDYWISTSRTTLLNCAWNG